MLRIGYTLSSEEFGPQELLKNAQLAEEAGFSFLSISDHYHPWVDQQGQSPFVWNMIGALSTVTKKANILIGVNCPIIRYHPALIAQAAATSQVMLEGRFILGVGSGENLNEHIIGRGWPPIAIRHEMLEEAILILRQLWQGGYQSYFGKYYTVDAARIYTLSENPIPIIVSAYGEKAALLAGKLGDGFISTSAEKPLIHTFNQHGGKGKPKYAQISICFDKSRERAKQILKRVWPISAMPRPLNTELRLPQDFQNTSYLISADDVIQDTPVGADTEAIHKLIKKYQSLGYDHIYIHNIGPNQKEFIQFFEREIKIHFKDTFKRAPIIKTRSRIVNPSFIGNFRHS